MAMRNVLRLITAALGLGAGGVIFFHQSSAIMAQTKTHEIGIVVSGGNFVFKPNTPIEINKDDSIVWVPQSGLHRLLPDTPGDAFEPTNEFDKDSPPEERTRTFRAPAVINYHCEIHPATMKQKITVR